MCFYIQTSNRNKKEQTATEDITVYKVIHNDNTSFFHDFPYKSNTLYRLRKKLKRSSTGKTIHKGFHSYSEIERASRNVYDESHSKIAVFTIPKDAKYYVNLLKKEYVSTSIRSGNLKPLYV